MCLEQTAVTLGLPKRASSDLAAYSSRDSVASTESTHAVLLDCLRA